MRGFLILVLSKRVISLVVIVVTLLELESCSGYNDERRIVKWNPYWLSSSNSPYSSPVSYNFAMGRGGLPKRLGGRRSTFGSRIYKWSPNYFADSGLFGSSTGLRYAAPVSNDFTDGLDINTERSRPRSLPSFANF